MTDVTTGAPAEEAYRNGMEALRLGDIDGALGHFRRVLTIDRDHDMATYQVATINQQMGHCDLADEYFAMAAQRLKETTEKGEKSLHARCALVHCLVVLDLPKEARSAANLAIAQVSDNRQAVWAVAVFFLTLNLIDAAYPILERIAKTGLPDAKAYLDLGRARIAVGQTENAMIAIERAIDLEPRRSECYELLGQAQRGSNLTAHLAAGAYRRGIAIAPSRGLYVGLAERLRVYGQFDDATEVLRKALNLYGESTSELWFLLGNVLKLSDRVNEANAAWEKALRWCQYLNAPNKTSRYLAGLEVLINWALGRRDQGLLILDAARRGHGSDAYRYDRTMYSANMPEKIRRLKNIIRGRDVAVLMHGPSMETLAESIPRFAGRDVCFMSAHSFALFENTMLNNIGSEVELAVVSNPLSMANHFDQVQEFVGRQTQNMLLTNRFCFDCSSMDTLTSVEFEGRFDSKLLLSPPPSLFSVPTPTSPLAFTLCNTLSSMLPFLVLGGAKRVFLFGCDGTARGEANGDYRFGMGAEEYRPRPRNEDEKRMMALNLLVDTLTFDQVADVSLEGVSVLYGVPVPPIYTVSPESHVGLFPKIDMAECLRMIAGEA